MPTGIYKRKPRSKEYRINISNALKGRKLTEEHIKNLSNSLKGRKGNFYSVETRKKIGDACRGKKHSKIWILRQSLAQKGKHTGEKSNFWKGGISYEPYSVDWTKTLKRSIRERDKYTCQICGKEQEDKTFCVHHIDYDKKNCDPNNLITLCFGCHCKTNFKREYWLSLFRKEV